RSRLPTWSARNGGFTRGLMTSNIVRNRARAQRLLSLTGATTSPVPRLLGVTNDNRVEGPAPIKSAAAARNRNTDGEDAGSRYRSRCRRTRRRQRADPP